MSVRSKKSLLSFVLCASLVSAATPVSQSTEQWRRLTGPEGDSINVLFSHGDSLFAGGHNVIYRSTDQGQSWESVNLGKIDRPQPITSFAAIGGTLFAGVRGELMLLSTDNGLTWTQMEVPDDITTFFTNPFPINVTALAANGGSIFALMKCESQSLLPCGIFRSTDNGKNWTRLGAGVAHRSIHSLAVVDGYLFAGGDYGGAALRSSDLGNNWTKINVSVAAPNGPANDIIYNAFALIGKQLFVGTNYGVFVSTDRGRSWTEASRDLRGMKVSGVVRKGEKLFAATWVDGVFVSLDQGRHWRTTGEFFSEKQILSLAGIGDHLLAWTRDGVYLSTDEGRSWTASETGFNGYYSHSFIVNGAKIFAGMNNRFMVSTDQGRSWTKLGAIGEDVAICALAAGEGIFFAGTSSGIFFSTDDGRSWAHLGGNFRFTLDTFSLAVNGPNILVGGVDGRINLSADRGQSWTMVNAGIDPPAPAAGFTQRTVVLNVNIAGKPLLIAGRDDGLFVSTSRGQTWRPTSVTGEVYALSVSGSTIFAGGAGGVFISKDNGLSWAPSNAGLDKKGYVQAFAVKGDRLYLAGHGVYVSSDGGRNWTPINEGLPDLDARELVANDTHLFLRTHHGRLFTRRL